MQNKYKDVTLGTVEAVFNKLGGIEGVESFLCGNVEITMVKHTIDLGKAPRLPFDHAEVVRHTGKGIVEIELRSDDNLYIDGKKVVLHRVVGHELCEEIKSGEQVLMNSNVLDYLYDHPEFFPEYWKKNERGETHLIFFWGTIFRDPLDNDPCVRCLCWSGGSLYQLCFSPNDRRLRLVSSTSVTN